eukprot:g416.t1
MEAYIGVIVYCVLIVLLVPEVEGHGALSFPRPRNSLDGSIAPWTNWAYPCDKSHQGENCSITFCEDGHNCEGSCPISARNGRANALTAKNGQACYWFSNGCTIGCEKCDGTQNHVGHGNQRFLYKEMNQSTIQAKNFTIENPFNPAVGTMTLDPGTTSSLNIKPNCANGNKNATICRSSLRTANTQAKCGGPEDFYFFSPWRAPGSAPVIDACGVAGGRFRGQGTGGAGAQFQNSSLAKQYDLGSELPAMLPQAAWKIGDAVEVGWTVQANHGGGYAYRLAPADAPLTEDTFRKTPLDFVGLSKLRWDGNPDTEIEFDSEEKGWQTDVGTTPEGSMWRKNPIPSGLWARMGPQFEPVCDESEECIRGFSTGLGGPQGVCKCSGYSNGGPLLPSVEIVDSIQVPAGLGPGRYVLQWRWDCEESDQVWASCSDVTLFA